ncbi:MAG: hypothetical protein IKD62_05285, partial [Oscillospiraceae bacterium]|nr:hypothetical protein [Oscillospiraceae bacterium]
RHWQMELSRQTTRQMIIHFLALLIIPSTFSYPLKNTKRPKPTAGSDHSTVPIGNRLLQTGPFTDLGLFFFTFIVSGQVKRVNSTKRRKKRTFLMILPMNVEIRHHYAQNLADSL